jgi:hypothetical protein
MSGATWATEDEDSLQREATRVVLTREDLFWRIDGALRKQQLPCTLIFTASRGPNVLDPIELDIWIAPLKHGGKVKAVTDLEALGVELGCFDPQVESPLQWWRDTPWFAAQ